MALARRHARAGDIYLNRRAGRDGTALLQARRRQRYGGRAKRYADSQGDGWTSPLPGMPACLPGHIHHLTTILGTTCLPLPVIPYLYCDMSYWTYLLLFLARVSVGLPLRMLPTWRIYHLRCLLAPRLPACTPRCPPSPALARRYYHLPPLHLPCLPEQVPGLPDADRRAGGGMVHDCRRHECRYSYLPRTPR